MAKKKRVPTVDERIGAISESVELLSGMQQHTERELREFMAGVRAFGRYAELVIRSHEKRIAKLERGS
jgi:hypothetical protein